MQQPQELWPASINANFRAEALQSALPILCLCLAPAVSPLLFHYDHGMTFASVALKGVLAEVYAD